MMTNARVEDQVVEEVIPMTEDGGAPVAPPALDMAAIIAAVQQTVAAQLAPIAARLDQVEARPTSSVILGGQDDLGIPDRMVDQDGLAGNSKTAPVTADGQLIDLNVMMGMRPQFRPGSLVRLTDLAAHGDNPDVATMLQKAKSRGVGRVERVMFMDVHNDRPQWKFRVRIPGLTGIMGNGYWAEELEAAI